MKRTVMKLLAFAASLALILTSAVPAAFAAEASAVITFTDDGAAVMPGNIATANQKYFHGSLLLLSIVGNQAPPSRAREICGM